MPKPLWGEDAATRTRLFEPYRLPITAPSRALADTCCALIEAEEEKHRLRKRARRPADRNTFRSLVAALVADLAYRWLETGGEEVADGDGVWLPAGLRLSLSRDALGRRSARYVPSWLGVTLRDIIAVMARPDVALASLEVGAWGTDHGKGTLSIIRPGQALIALLEEAAFPGIGFHDLGLCPTAEVVLLRAPDASFWDRGKLVDYTDDAETDRLRDEVRSINTWLSRADITVLREHPGAGRVDPSLRRMRRCFNRSTFQSGGRLFGGFWQPMTREERKAIRLDGEETITLDYGQIGPRILYGMAGQVPPAGDLYSLPMLDGQHRDGVKKLLAAASFYEGNGKPMKRPPDGCPELFPEGLTIRAMLTAIELAHPGLRPLLYRGLGHQAQRTESDILVAVLLKLQAMGITALPIHDAVIVPRSTADAVEVVMRETFREITRLPIQVKRE
ncbi:hypothetical protein FFK22_009320 [Mycobacterium sp. KBS0706]|uniref:hypothetical protein n=1 Tax=Mycobacterium sp. KBS0706 TaxID=2578109 RepID=UPI00110FE921|nr:hypothetical protein [Mycobacterium sp. KBS0706]TSD88913.1 hypothetical protein FFK22_009320 [Mycobacterium sp. KBS0706]